MCVYTSKPVGLREGRREMTLFNSIVSFSIFFPCKSGLSNLSGFGGALGLQAAASLFPAEHKARSPGGRGQRQKGTVR